MQRKMQAGPVPLSDTPPPAPEAILESKKGHPGTSPSCGWERRLQRRDTPTPTPSQQSPWEGTLATLHIPKGKKKTKKPRNVPPQPLTHL